VKPVLFTGPVRATGIDSLSAERCVEAFNGAHAKEPNGPMLSGSDPGPQSMPNFINSWLMELGLTT
jgi:hypothetical protein